MPFPVRDDLDPIHQIGRKRALPSPGICESENLECAILGHILIRSARVSASAFSAAAFGSIPSETVTCRNNVSAGVSPCSLSTCVIPDISSLLAARLCGVFHPSSCTTSKRSARPFGANPPVGSSEQAAAAMPRPERTPAGKCAAEIR